jgi:hypothetical protein
MPRNGSSPAISCSVKNLTYSLFGYNETQEDERIRARLNAHFPAVQIYNPTENRISKRVLCMNLETTRPRGRPRNKWQDEVRENGRVVGGEEWQEKSI